MERIRSERTVARRIFSRACTALDQELKKEEVDYESACAKMRTVEYEAQKLFELDEEMKVKLFAEEIDEEDQVKEFEDMSDYRRKNKGKLAPKKGNLKNLYRGPLPISRPKFNDLQHLKGFLINPEARAFYENLPLSREIEDNDEDIYLDYMLDDED
ncbi:hypothetical protein GE061_018693 [Apolygus lucorum]|uniref:Uncharacterized protein n=1 Tax=Apolygus lucorum TaxID=248454 RepID=A0A8S9XEG8_APOLU|nr:hypothetical protein GE061_018693 [Apolygus lucorum]